MNIEEDKDYHFKEIAFQNNLLAKIYKGRKVTTFQILKQKLQKNFITRDTQTQ